MLRVRTIASYIRHRYLFLGGFALAGCILLSPLASATGAIKGPVAPFEDLDILGPFSGRPNSSLASPSQMTLSNYLIDMLPQLLPGMPQGQPIHGGKWSEYVPAAERFTSNWGGHEIEYAVFDFSTPERAQQAMAVFSGAEFKASLAHHISRINQDALAKVQASVGTTGGAVTARQFRDQNLKTYLGPPYESTYTSGGPLYEVRIDGEVAHRQMFSPIVRSKRTVSGNAAEGGQDIRITKLTSDRYLSGEERTRFLRRGQHVLAVTVALSANQLNRPFNPETRQGPFVITAPAAFPMGIWGNVVAIVNGGQFNGNGQNPGAGSSETTQTPIVVNGTLYDVTVNKTLRSGDHIPIDHIVRTGPDAGAEVILPQDIAKSKPSYVVLAPNSEAKITLKEKKRNGAYLFFGRIFTLFHGKNGFAIETYNSVAGVEGTVFETAYNKALGRTALSVFEGAVSLQSKNCIEPSVMVLAGMGATMDSTCNHASAPLPESANTPAKAGWTIAIGGAETPEITGPHNPWTGNTKSAGTTRYPIADSHVYAYAYSGWNMANWGKYERLGAGWHPTGGEKRIYLKFDLSGVDPANLGKASLRLFHYHTGGGNHLALGVYRVTSPWTEGVGTYQPAATAAPDELTWVHQPLVDTRPVAQFNPGPGTGKWVEVDITPLVSAWLAGTPNHGLMIRAEGSLTTATPISQYGFYSREAEVDKRPVLVLKDTVGQPLSGGGVAPINVPVFGAAPGRFDRAIALPCASDEDFIRSLYHCIAQRDPTVQELQAQVDRLRGGVLRKQMVSYFLSSPGYVNQGHDGVRFMTDASQAIYARQPTEAELRAWPRTQRSVIIDDMFKDPAHFAATRNCPEKWSMVPAVTPPSATLNDDPGWQTKHMGSHDSISPKAGQWRTTGGGFMAMSGAHRFDKRWFRFTGGEHDNYYLNDEDTKSPPRHTPAEVLSNAKIKQGTIMVRGPGALAYFFRRKAWGPNIRLYDATSGQRFLIHNGGEQTMYQTRNWVYKDGKWNGAWTGNWSGSANELFGDRPMSGWVPAGQVKKLDVFIEQGSYHNQFVAPSEFEYELWFFPHEGGAVKAQMLPAGME